MFFKNGIMPFCGLLWFAFVPNCPYVSQNYEVQKRKMKKKNICKSFKNEKLHSRLKNYVNK